MATPENTPNIPAQLVKELRERTGAGFATCREALIEAKGDLEQATSILRKKGQSAAQKKAQRTTSEGLVASYIHAGGKIGVLLELNCESDFVARTEDFQKLCHDVAMHIAALDPRFLRREEVTQEILDRKRDSYKEEARASGKPDNIVEKIVTGKMEKFYEENCLYEQHFIRDEGMTVKELIDLAIGKLGENIAVRRYSRFKVGDSDGAAAAGGQEPTGPQSAAPTPAPGGPASSSPAADSRKS
ncbi:MAG: translation elongation factor Ts [Candidatus Acidiferrales bacterium]